MSNINLTPKHSFKNVPNNLDKIKIEARERKRNIFYLILAYLKENMLEQTAESLIREARLDSGFRICDNVELDIILQEYQSYYYTKFHKYPKIVRKLEESELNRSNKRGKSAKRSTATPAPTKQNPESILEGDTDFQFEIVPLNNTTKIDTKTYNKPKMFVPELDYYTPENRDLITQISKQVIVQDIDVKWTDCLGLDNAVEILKESTIYPLDYPEIFKDLIPWRGVLLHGPPGTGKTLLAKALASEANTTFFNVTSSTFISKWRGESEKLIKHLFDMAKVHAPSTIFFDELDALVAGAGDVQHEASKRFRSELLIELDGISSIEDRVFVLASTNSPWDLDKALLRRFDKRILIDMPAKEARALILKHHLKNTDIKITEGELDEFGNLTDHYSGADIKNLSKEVAMAIVREKIKSIGKGCTKNLSGRVAGFDDIKVALQKVRPSLNSLICKRYYQWQNEHGAF